MGNKYEVSVKISDQSSFLLEIPNIFRGKGFVSFDEMFTHIKEKYLDQKNIFTLENIVFHVGTNDGSHASLPYMEDIPPGKYHGKISYICGGWHFDITGQESKVLVFSEDFEKLEKIFNEGMCQYGAPCQDVCFTLQAQPYISAKEQNGQRLTPCAPFVQQEQRVKNHLIDARVEGSIDDIIRVDFKIGTEHVQSKERLAHILKSCREAESKLRATYPGYEDKVSHKVDLYYSGPIKSRRAVLSYDCCDNTQLCFQDFYMDACASF